MEDCNIVIMNLGLHYDPRGDMLGKHYAPLMQDMYAAITYLANFTSTEDDRIAIWRSALPQHFDTFDGNYDQKELRSSHVKSCVPVKDSTSKQPYNTKYEAAFSQLCNDGAVDIACDGLLHSCNVNLTSQDFYSVYSYWKRNNLTEDIEAFLRMKNTTAIGEILHWNIYDLFDVSSWHSENSDCTHFCFIPAMFEGAFYRLELLLSAFESI